MTRELKVIGIAFFSLTVFLTSCESNTQDAKPSMALHAHSFYTCSMHPQVHEENPGDCPICSMKLIRMDMKEPKSTADGTLTLTTRQLTLAGIQTDTVREENTGEQKIFTGTVTTNENRAEAISARVAGRVQQLYVRTTGEKITKGQAIYSIYSEELQETEGEYLLALAQQKILKNPDVDYPHLILTAKHKLQLWGLLPSQIKALVTLGKVVPTTRVLSNVSGTVSDIAIHEGDYVTEGMPILKVQALNSLWVEAQLYASEIGNYQAKDRVSVSFPNLGGRIINGKLDFKNPELSGPSQVNLVRINIPNTEGLIRPGMLAYILVTKDNQHMLAVPASAVLRSGKGSMVWIKNRSGDFSPRMITFGLGNSSYMPVLSGLQAGEVVVTNGAYLLNSESIFKNGDKTMGGMKM